MAALARPPTLVHAKVPRVVPPLAGVYVLMDRVTVEVLAVTTLLLASSTDTDGWVAKAVPSMTPPTGWVVTMTLKAAPVTTDTAEVVVEASVPSVADST